MQTKVVEIYNYQIIKYCRRQGKNKETLLHAVETDVYQNINFNFFKKSFFLFCSRRNFKFNSLLPFLVTYFLKTKYI